MCINFQAFDLLSVLETLEKNSEADDIKANNDDDVDKKSSMTSSSGLEPGVEVSDCLGRFLICLDDRSSSDDLSLKTRGCYKGFQDCSGTVIIIPDLYRASANNKP